jgi:hypothetical protein
MMARRAERAALAAAVLLLHLLLWWAWPRHALFERGPHDGIATQPPLSVRLLPIDPPPPRQVAPQAVDAVLRAAPPRAAAAARETGTRALAITVAPDEQTAASSPSAAASTPPALDLTLPSAVAAPRSPSMRDQWRIDPRSNTPRASVESRIAALSGPDRWEAEPMDATRTRWRRNGKCIEVHVARNAQIDPYNQSFSPTPKGVKSYCD